MEAKDNDELKIRQQREAALARRLGEALDQLNPRSAKDCLDAEVIAAFAEHTLGADELAQCENHFAACGRCRNILRVLAAASDAPLAENELAQLGQRASAVRAPVEITASAPRRTPSKVASWNTRWLAPALGIAAVLTVWFVMRPPWRSLDRGASTTLVAQAPPQDMSAPEPSAAEQPQKTASVPENRTPKNESRNSSAEPSARENLKPRNEIRDRSRDANLAENLPDEKKESAVAADHNEGKTLALPSPPPPSPPPQAAVSSAMNSAAPMLQSRDTANSPAPKAPEPQRSVAQSDALAEAPAVRGGNAEAANRPVAGIAPQKSQADTPINGRNFQTLFQLRPVPAIPILIKAATGVPVWRIGTAGTIERSTNAGKTWVPQISPSKEDWLSGAAISDSACWIAGRNGAIARTMDGEHWERIAPPPTSAAKGKAPDWTGITALDAQSATVTSSNGNKFATTDGGKSWQRQ